MKKYDLEILIGYSCNNNCIFCSNRALKERVDKGNMTMSFDDISHILKPYKGREVETLFLIGGEPTIRKDILRIITLAKSLGYHNILMLTNGRMLKNIDFARKIAETNVRIGFSVHGDCRCIHDKLTRTAGSFEQMVSGMNNITFLGKKFVTNTVINKTNYKRASKIISFLSAYNPYFILFSLVSPKGLPIKDIKSLLPDPLNLQSFIRESISTAKRLNQKIKFADFPLCIMGQFEDYMAEKDFKHDRKIIAKGVNSFFYLKNKNKNEKIKPLICSKCGRNKDCNGLWKGYFEVYGDTALTPFMH